MTTVALFGGSFNPPHVAHQMVCLYVLETAEVDRVWMVPAYRHAFGKDLAPFEDRVAMCELAAEIFGGRVEVSRIEEEIGGESRTIRTVEELERRMPDAALRLVLGTDILAERASWRRFDDLVRKAPPILIARAGHPAPPGEGPAGPVLPEISSTDVRARLSRGEGARPLLSRAVMDYIARRGLYR